MTSKNEKGDMIDDVMKDKILWALATFHDAFCELKSNEHGSKNISIQETLNNCSNSMKAVAYAITANASGDHDAAGNFVTSLTESVMGVTDGLVKIAEAIEKLADAVADSNRDK